ncbi:hypothetical protein [Pseudomonas sp. RIT411]|uniref:hypothetical protein n=1 Tax=Pseudomonas sp. RIT411 TaxID=2202160 RepID=UPI000D393A27|nr:hypothetical protein [Pseudomonas sp. RIT 411]RAU39209.1 hypothetical protein DBY63_012065 [Pseudomonas sp. RIT 411]
MSRIVSSNTLGMQVLEALGIDPANVSAVQISLQAMEPATIQITRTIKDEEARQIVGLLSVYRIEPAEAIGAEDD